GRTPCFSACDPWADHIATRRCQRGSRGLPLSLAATPSACGACIVATTAADAGSRQVCVGLRRRTRRLRARRRAGRSPRSNPHRPRNEGTMHACLTWGFGAKRRRTERQSAHFNIADLVLLKAVFGSAQELKVPVLVGLKREMKMSYNKPINSS